MTNNNITTAAMDSSHPLWDPDWKEGAGEATIREHLAKEDAPITLYCSFFCPFAQRAWIAAEELGIDYKYVECNPYEVDPNEKGGYTKKALLLSEKKRLMPDFLQTSPRGLVPAIFNTAGGERIWESAVVMEYLDQVFGEQRLYTPFPEGQALIRIYVDHCTSRIQKSYYTLLMQQSAEAQAQAKAEFFRECRALACAMAPLGGDTEGSTPKAVLEATMDALKAEEQEGKSAPRVDMETLSLVSQEAFSQRLQQIVEPGPFFLGSHFSGVDIALAPFWQRILWVGGHYRGLELPKDAAFERLHRWWEAVSTRPSVARTLVGKERLISTYRQYAVNEGTSDFAANLGVK